MGLDILTYREEGERIGIFDFDEELHQIIFSNDTIDWDENYFLYLINDFYKANATYAGKDLQSFIQELENVRSFIPKNKQYKLDHLLHSFSSNEIYKVRVTGD